MKTKAVLAGLLTLLAITACEQKPTADSILQKILAEYDSENFLKKHAILAIPLEGCSPCIEQSIAFVKENFEEEKIGYIISSISPKVTKFTIGQKAYESDNVLMDHHLKAVEFQLIPSAPGLFYLENGRVTRFIYLDSNNSKATLTALINDLTNHGKSDF